MRRTEAVVRTNYPRAFMVIAAVVLATILLLLIVATKPAEAAFPGRNGKIVFESNRDGNSEIYTMQADGSAQTWRTTNSISDSTPAYSPDGKQIVFTSQRDGNGEIYRMQVNGSLQTLLFNNPAHDSDPNWQPLKKRRR